MKRLYQQLMFNDKKIIGSEKLKLSDFFERFPIVLMLFRHKISKTTLPVSFSYRLNKDHSSIEMYATRWLAKGVIMPDLTIDNLNMNELICDKFIPSIEKLLKFFGQCGDDQVITSVEQKQLLEQCDQTILLLLKIRRRIETTTQ